MDPRNLLRRGGVTPPARPRAAAGGGVNPPRPWKSLLLLERGGVTYFPTVSQKWKGPSRTWRPFFAVLGRLWPFWGPKPVRTAPAPSGIPFPVPNAPNGPFPDRSVAEMITGHLDGHWMALDGGWHWMATGWHCMPSLL